MELFTIMFSSKAIWTPDPSAVAAPISAAGLLTVVLEEERVSTLSRLCPGYASKFAAYDPFSRKNHM